MPGTARSPSPQWEVSPSSLVVPCGFPAEHRRVGRLWPPPSVPGSLPRAFLPPNTRFAAVSAAPGPCPVGWRGLEGWVPTRGPCSLGLSYPVPLAFSSLG